MVYMLETKEGLIAVEKRPDDRMLGGMLSFPTTDWDKKDALQANKHPDDIPNIKKIHKIGTVSHTFSHFHLKLDVWHGIMSDNDLKLFNKSRILRYYSSKNLENIGLPTVFKKSLTILRTHYNQE